VSERTQPTLPGVEETVVQNVQGSDLASDPKSIPSASELEIEMTDAASSQPSLLDRAGVTDTTPAKELPQAKPTAAHSDAPYCYQCGVQMQRAGSCHACPSCGSTSGCS
jgi:ribonucleoside-diphosphate reductase alpha chain